MLFEEIREGQIFRLARGPDTHLRWRRINFQQAERVVFRDGRWVEHESNMRPVVQNVEVELVA